MKDLPLTDSQLLELISAPATKERGFRLLVHEYGDKLFRHIRYMVYADEDANDVLQNTLIKVFQYIDRFEGKSKLYTWLYRIATNEALSYLEKQKKRRNVFSTSDETHHLLKADTMVDGDYITERLNQAIATLPPKQRAVFNLRYFEEKSYQEMAEVFTTSVGGLKASYHHAVKKVEAFLKKEQ